MRATNGRWRRELAQLPRGCGGDTLIGGAGADLMYGDADLATSDVTTVTRGRDRFLFDEGSGFDTIGDFEARGE